MTDAKELLTAGTALTGAVLGIFNLWRQVSADRVKIRVTPSIVVDQRAGGIFASTTYIVDPADPPDMVSLAVEILNLSSFPVTIEEIGMTARGSARMSFIGAESADHKSLPIRIESRDAIKLYTTPYLISEFAPAVHVFADTVCNNRQIGKSPAIEGLKTAAIRLKQQRAEQ
ncbi:hypothetical protein [Caballeronia sordidicola]|uniref:hypothetical protein n=1 Tax=Caballeronia sordidicola TaxID=196367 RepID=UPI000A3BEC16|nr:hypothetical protein [Caballeronia sordidicola]